MEWFASLEVADNQLLDDSVAQPFIEYIQPFKKIQPILLRMSGAAKRRRVIESDSDEEAGVGGASQVEELSSDDDDLVTRRHLKRFKPATKSSVSHKVSCPSNYSLPSVHWPCTSFLASPHSVFLMPSNINFEGFALHLFFQYNRKSQTTFALLLPFHGELLSYFDRLLLHARMGPPTKASHPCGKALE
jgi:hypothetical protein